MKLSLRVLRRRAIASSLFSPTTLERAVGRLGFVQADPIQAPARAQDLILRVRVRDYRVGDLNAKYGSLGLEEDFLYAYGFMPQSTSRLLHPRPSEGLSEKHRALLDLITQSHMHRHHPRDFEVHFGHAREVNAWGGYSKTTTKILQDLHYRGHLRVVGREKGVRIYGLPLPHVEVPGDPGERLERVILLLAELLGPLPLRSLRLVVQYLAHGAPSLKGRGAGISRLVASGQLVVEQVEGLQYAWPATLQQRGDRNKRVRFLAPFDPLVWDRARFAHFWGWCYRFEAYTPAQKRELGYYALPMLWREDIIGWVNISKGLDGQIDVKPGFVMAKPNERDFDLAFDEEVELFQNFMRVRQ